MARMRRLIVDRRRCTWRCGVFNRRRLQRAVDVYTTELRVDVLVGNVLSIRLVGGTFRSLVVDVSATCTSEPTGDERGSCCWIVVHELVEVRKEGAFPGDLL
jgi:hypothetical protein